MFEHVYHDVMYVFTGGFLWVDEILRRNEYRDFTEEDIKHIVKTNDKQRFSLADENGRLKIRANQGHSVEVLLLFINNQNFKVFTYKLMNFRFLQRQYKWKVILIRVRKPLCIKKIE